MVGHECQVDLSLRRQREGAERLEERLVRSVLGDGEGDPIHGAGTLGRHRIGDAHLELQGLGLLEVLMLVVAVAQVQSGRHVGRHTFDAANQPFDDAVEGLRVGGLEATLQDREFDGDVPLNGHVVVRNRRQQPVKIGEQCPLIRRFEPILILAHDPTVDRRQRSRVLDLETDV